MKQRNAELLLAGVIVARATSLLFSKLSMRALDPFNLLGLRFTIAFGLLMLLFGRLFGASSRGRCSTASSLAPAFSR